MNEPNQTALLARSARRTNKRLDYIGWILDRYAKAEGMTEQGISEQLGVSGLDLYRLHLCLRPRAQFFAADVQQIATKFGLDGGVLAKIVRHVEALEGMKEDFSTQSVGEIGVLLAARTRNKRANCRPKGKGDGKRKKP